MLSSDVMFDKLIFLCNDMVEKITAHGFVETAVDNHLGITLRLGEILKHVIQHAKVMKHCVTSSTLLLV